jgi:hypothetical protein
MAAPSRRCHALRMGDRTRSRHRCTECRSWFAAKASATLTQRVCGDPACRRGRRAKLARRRRRRNEDDCRIDERERQRKHRDAVREGRAAAAAFVPTDESDPSRRHAPPSTQNRHELRREMLDAWDDAMAASRATLQRCLAVILARNARTSETATRPVTAMSRATLDANGAVFTE